MAKTEMCKHSNQKRTHYWAIIWPLFMIVTSPRCVMWRRDNLMITSKIAEWHFISHYHRPDLTSAKRRAHSVLNKITEQWQSQRVPLIWESSFRSGLTRCGHFEVKNEMRMDHLMSEPFEHLSAIFSCFPSPICSNIFFPGWLGYCHGGASECNSGTHIRDFLAPVIKLLRKETETRVVTMSSILSCW